MAGLTGMKEICKYWGRQEATMLKLIRLEDFPAEKIMGSWSADTDLIDDWRKNKIKTKIKAKGVPA